MRLYTERDHPGIHVSGHPCRDELKQMYQWARPQIAVPTHGERRHLLEHAALARDLQVPADVAPRNGDMVRLAPGRAEIIDEVPSGPPLRRRRRAEPEDGEALRERRHAAHNGVLPVSLALDKRGSSPPGCRSGASACRATRTTRWRRRSTTSPTAPATPFKRLDAEDRDDDEAVEQAISRALKKARSASGTAARSWRRWC